MIFNFQFLVIYTLPGNFRLTQPVLSFFQLILLKILVIVGLNFH